MSETPPILIVDDQEKLLKLVILLMNRLGFPDVEGVNDAPTALERLRTRKYALVISDLDMEPMDGLAFLREIRADDALMNTPFILKPFDMSVLKSKLKQVINRKPRKREAPLAAESTITVDFPMLGKF